MSAGGETGPPNRTLSSFHHHPTSCTTGFTPLLASERDFLQAPPGAVDFGFAFMRTLLPVLAVVAMLLLDATSAQAADCACDLLSVEGCADGAQGAPMRGPPTAPPLWCERTDDPRCMPASTHGTSVDTLVPVAMSWAQPIRWNAPPRTGTRLTVWLEGDARTEHSRRVDRPPR
jgi:hypothetical protein